LTVTDRVIVVVVVTLFCAAAGVAIMSAAIAAIETRFNGMSFPKAAEAAGVLASDRSAPRSQRQF
jgi:hypothetical protein